MLNLTLNKFRFIVYDLDYVNQEGLKKNKLILVAWVPDGTSIQVKFRIASAVAGVKDTFKIYKDFNKSSLGELQLENLIPDLK